MIGGCIEALRQGGLLLRVQALPLGVSRDRSVEVIFARDIGHEHLIVISYRLHLQDVHGSHLRDACRLTGPALWFLEMIWRLDLIMVR